MMSAQILTPESLRASLTQKLSASYVEVEDISGGCGSGFEAIIVSDVFNGKKKLARDRLVNAALKEEIAAMHAWTRKCYTPEEWSEKGEKPSGFTGAVEGTAEATGPVGGD